jgi:hypothetical protein
MSPRIRVLAGAGAVLAFAVVAVLAFLILKLGHASDQIAAQVEQGAARDRAVAALASGDSQLRAQVRSLGGTPNVPPPQVVVSAIPGAAGQQGPGPSDAQVATAVAAYLLAHPVPGVPLSQVESAVTAALAASPPPSGPPGPGPSDRQVADAVAAYLQANPPPSGPAGAQGQPGRDGRDGQNCPDGYSLQPESINGHDALVCERPASASPSQSPTPSGTASPTASPSATPTGSPSGGATSPTQAASAPLLGPTLPAAAPARPRPFPHSALWPLQPLPLLLRRTA